MQNFIDESRPYVMLPKGSSGKVRFTSLTPTTKSAAEAGAKLAETYIHASLLPTLGVIDYNRRRAGYLNGMLLLNNMTNPSTAMHEITHGIEEQNPHVLAASLSFLEKRAGNESPQLLRELTGNSAYTTELAYEDEFASRGGDSYMGRRYLGDDGTEILTMGIERLHKNPVEFYVNDPEYFEFVINTLQNP